MPSTSQVLNKSQIQHLTCESKKSNGNKYINIQTEWCFDGGGWFIWHPKGETSKAGKIAPWII